MPHHFELCLSITHGVCERGLNFFVESQDTIEARKKILSKLWPDSKLDCVCVCVERGVNALNVYRLSSSLTDRQAKNSTWRTRKTTSTDATYVCPVNATHFPREIHSLSRGPNTDTAYHYWSYCFFPFFVFFAQKATVEHQQHHHVRHTRAQRSALRRNDASY